MSFFLTSTNIILGFIQPFFVPYNWMKLIILRMKINCSLTWMYFKGEREGFEVIWGAKRFGRMRGGVPLILKKNIYIYIYIYHIFFIMSIYIYFFNMIISLPSFPYLIFKAFKYKWIIYSASSYLYFKIFKQREDIRALVLGV